METPDLNISYTDALAELEGILEGLRGDHCDVDTLASRTRRAAVLLAKVLEELEN